MYSILLEIMPFEDMVDFISQPWHWGISGVMLSLVMFLLLYFGGQFGVSSTLRTLCSIGGAGKKYNFFDFDWKSQIWNLVFVSGAVLGGFIATNFLQSPEPVQLAASTVEHLSNLGIQAPTELSEGKGFVPKELFDLEEMLTLKNLFILVLGGFLVGFGTRYAGGCTSGHAISGLSNLQIPSLVAVIGFFMGGLLMTHFILPFILGL
jgi:uncharacterized membrane protein YedE/YeeE